MLLAIRSRRPWQPCSAIVAGWVAVDGVRYAQLQSGLQNIRQVPLSLCGIEYPLLQPCRGLRGGHCIQTIGIGVVTVALISDIHSVGIREPDSEWERSRIRGGSREAFQHAHIVGVETLGLQQGRVIVERAVGRVAVDGGRPTPFESLQMARVGSTQYTVLTPLLPRATPSPSER